ncbi:hypothetical protein BS47DRAFT_1302585 [Hydnum rufescens UP504]|uniref:GRIP domain-containing protein n=1 Tax=Hydnum rufescens UP504 TaxID=1448309 RepID=A0A9P6DRQ3_9AGAM|nr:hypothetical protein BS47DRAFT_1302585 [Hydnum rufescens UP504]
MADQSSPAVDAANETLAGLRLSIDSNGNGLPSLLSSPSVPQVNGIKSSGHNESGQIALLQEELERTRAEKGALDAQYHILLEKVTAMRTTLGNKLRQDAEELDRREQLIQSLTARTDDLQITVDTLNAELIASNDEVERVSRELDAIRSRALEDNAYESSLREREAAEFERVRREKDEWERVAMEERVRSEEYRAQAESLQRDLEVESAERKSQAQEVLKERQTAANLQSVLEDFQSVKELEIRQAVSDVETQLRSATALLAEFKHRAYMAEDKLSSSSANAQLVSKLEKEVKEKSLLIGKLRHETVIINEHLTEALRRLRTSSSDSTVDRRLITNMLLQFLTTSRGDGKRFEMLSIFSSILSWDDSERERAGLQRAGTGTNAPPSLGGRRVSSGSKIPDLDKADEPESFSKMWVEFLLKESATASAPVPSPNITNSTSSPTTPTSLSHSNLGERRTSLNPPRSLRVPSPNDAAAGSSNLPSLASPTLATAPRRDPSEPGIH